ncbi:Bestrophin 1b, partial [Operophtera brumata]
MNRWWNQYTTIPWPDSIAVFVSATIHGQVNYCSVHGNVIPLSFVLGFYVTVVMNRWWNQYTTIPWPDSIAVFVSATIHGQVNYCSVHGNVIPLSFVLGFYVTVVMNRWWNQPWPIRCSWLIRACVPQDERGRLMRRTIVRYVCLCLTMVLTMISPRVKKRFPTLDNLVEAGLLLENEKSILNNMNEKFPKPSKHWLPIVWATSIVTRARKEGRIRDDFAVKTIIDELNKFRGQAGLLLSYDTISVPLVYTQLDLVVIVTSARKEGRIRDDFAVGQAGLSLSYDTISVPLVYTQLDLVIIVTRARKEGRIRDDFAVKTIIDELNKFRGQAGLLLSYGTISVPLVYTQLDLVVIVTRARKEGRIRDDFAVKTIIDELNKFRGQAGQWVDHKYQHASSNVYISNIDLYFPIFATLEFFFYMGWLKVAESLINPFGEDDDDFEVNWLIDRDLQVSYMIVDEMHHEHPELIKDQYWDEVFPSELPYTIATENQREEHPEHSTARIAVPMRQRSMVLTTPSQIQIDKMVPSNTVSYKFDPPEQLQMNDDAVSGIHFIVPRGSRRGKKEDRNSMGSTNSMASLAQQTPIPRTNSVTSMLKRLFSKEEQRGNAQTDGTVSRFTISASNPQLNKPTAAAGSMKIANEVIEEGDEQATITSMAKRPDVRPTAMSLFAPMPPPSDPVDVPAKTSNHSSKTRLSSSAPNPWGHTRSTGDKSPAAESLDTHGSLGSLPDARPRLDSDVGPELSAAGSHT